MIRTGIFPYPIYLLEGEDDDTGGGGGGGGEGDDKGGDKGGDAAGQARLEAMEKAVTLLAQGHSELTQGMAALISKLDQEKQPGKGNDPSEEHTEEPDLETMDRKQYTTWLMEKIRGAFQQEVKPLNDKFSQLDEKIDGHTLGTMVERFVNDPKNPHPDFYEWKDEMRALVKENPTLTPARLYSLARVENRAKAEKLDEKYGLNKPQKKNGEDKFLSLFPGSGSSTTKGGTGKMSPKEAAEKAWDQVMSGLG